MKSQSLIKDKFIFIQYFENNYEEVLYNKLNHIIL